MTDIASPGSDGISGSVDINRDNFTLANLKNLTAADVFLSRLPKGTRVGAVVFNNTATVAGGVDPDSRWFSRKG